MIFILIVPVWRKYSAESATAHSFPSVLALSCWQSGTGQCRSNYQMEIAKYHKSGTGPIGGSMLNIHQYTTVHSEVQELWPEWEDKGLRSTMPITVR